MDSKSKVERGRRFIKELADILKDMTDHEFLELFSGPEINEFFISILDPEKVKEFDRLAEFLLQNKTRAAFLAQIRYAITHNYSFKGTNKDGIQGYVSPWFAQWFEDGVMFLEGKEPFTGSIGLYRNNEIKYAIATRDIRPGERMDKNYFEFVSIEDFKKLGSTIEVSELDKPVHELKVAS